VKADGRTKRILSGFSMIFCFAVSGMAPASGSELENFLSREKNLIYDYEEEANRLQSSILRKSWISPIMLNYSEISSTQPWNGDVTDRTFSIGIDQPIFKSGGIIYAVKFANVKENATRAEIELQRRRMIVSAISILFDLRKARLQKEQLALLVRNDNIDIRRKREQYDAGIIDSSFLDQAIIQRNRDQTRLLATELSERTLRNSFSLLSDLDPDTLKLPKLTLIDENEYRALNRELEIRRLRVQQNEYNSKMTWAKYLPVFSLTANYYATDYGQPIPGMDDDYYRYGFRISMPLNINAPEDIESSRVEYLRSAVELQDEKKKVDNEYRLVLDTIRIIDKKIELARSDERLYRSLLKSTREQVAAGEKTRLDTEIMRNSMKMARLDAMIYAIEKQIQLLKLYEKIHR